MSCGARELDMIRRATSARYRPSDQMRTGGIRRPSPKCSLAVMSNEPGTLPPTSAQCPLDCEKAMISPSWKIGRTTRTSLKWVPPR